MSTEQDVENTTTEMQKMMGFSAFHSTKGTKVPGNEHNYGAAIPQTPMQEEAAAGGGVAVPTADEIAESGRNRPVEQREHGWTVETATRELKRILGVGEEVVGGGYQSRK
jgi:hypothetical protein